MPLPNTKFREMVLQLLFAFEMNAGDEEGLLALIMEELKTTRKEVEEGLKKARAITLKLEEIDSRIASFSHDYAIDRIHKIEKNVLRLSLYDLLFEKSLNGATLISEAIRLTKKFGTPDGSRFVHAILDKVSLANDPVCSPTTCPS